MDHPRPLAKRRPIFLLFFSLSPFASSPERPFPRPHLLNSPNSRTAAVMGRWSSFSHHGSQQALPHRVPQPHAARGSFARNLFLLAEQRHVLNPENKKGREQQDRMPLPAIVSSRLAFNSE
ncbi:hypothetical protein BKA81DRAFT_230790 [Phyllosticta paracitricarpa]